MEVTPLSCYSSPSDAAALASIINMVLFHQQLGQSGEKYLDDDSAVGSLNWFSLLAGKKKPCFPSSPIILSEFIFEK